MSNQALHFAVIAHDAVGQRRKYTDVPYIVHPIRVANIVHEFRGTKDMIAAAYFHDTVEDTNVTMEDIQSNFGPDIAVIVEGLTDVSIPSDGNRELRKAIDRQHSADASYEAQFVKCADIIDNSSDISNMDPSFWKVYQREMKLLLDVMDKVKTTPIYTAATKAVK